MKLSFHGAARGVTGSRHIIQLRGARILLDCGLFQGHRKESFDRNRNLGFRPKDIDAVVLSHAHIDHSGALPAFVRAGYAGPVYATGATADLAAVMLEDSAHIQERDIEKINRREKRSLEPAYTVDDARATSRLFRPVPYGESVEIADGVSLSLHDAGHMLGSSVVRLEAEGRPLVFSGDLGRDVLPILRTPQLLSGAHAIIVESTYGNRYHEAPEDEEKKIETLVRRVVERNGKVLVPAFAVGRTQHLTYRLKKLSKKLPQIPVFVDSPLAANVTDVYRRHPECHEPGTWKSGDPFGFGMLRYTRSTEESRKLNDLDGPAIIIAASGMCEHGRILHHLLHHGTNARNVILFVGYQANHTLGRRILEGQRRVRIYGREVELRAEVVKMNGLSAHADRAGLEEFVRAHARTLRNAFVVHGEETASETFAGWIRNTTAAKVRVPDLGETVELDG